MKEKEIRSQEALDQYLELVKKDCRTFYADKRDFIVFDCPACNSNDYSVEFSKEGFAYVLCSFCRTLYARNRPPFDKLNQFYAQSESVDFWINEFFKPVAEARREKIFRPRAEYLVGYFGEGDPGWAIGDIGSGFGIFLDELRKLWPDSTYVAIEPSSEQCEICNQMDFKTECCALEALEGYDSSFDLLIAFELFEHLHNPYLFLSKVYGLLKPGGWLLITTLNGLGFDFQVLWEQSESIYPPCHINFFNPSSISLLLKNCGFQTVEVETPGRLDWEIVERMIISGEVNTERFWRLLAGEGNEACKQDFQRWLSKYNMSSHMRVLANKPLK